MGNQQNPEGVYIPPGVNKRYPLNYNQPPLNPDYDADDARIQRAEAQQWEDQNPRDNPADDYIA